MNVFIKREYDYAIRITAFLAGIYPNGHRPVTAIANALYLTRPFTTKIVQQLRNGGLVGTVQGKYGGVFLKKAPEQISLWDVLQAVGFNASMNECLKNPALCPLNVTCKVHSFFIQQENQLIQNLKKAKISEFSFSESELKKS